MTDEPSVSAEPPTSSEERAAMGVLIEEVLPALVTRLRASRLGELEVSTDGWRVRLRRETSVRAATTAASGAATAAPDAAGTELPGEAINVVRSPAVGYFTPGREVAVGRSVRAGDSLGTVEVLGIVQDVTAPGDGVVSSVLAEAGQAVEYGQPLADIDPLGADRGATAEMVSD